MTSIGVQFLEDLFEYLKEHGKKETIKTIINSANIQQDMKQILLWKHYEGLLNKQISVCIQKKENLVEPLSDRQVIRRHQRAMDSLYRSIIETFDNLIHVTPKLF